MLFEVTAGIIEDPFGDPEMTASLREAIIVSIFNIQRRYTILRKALTGKFHDIDDDAPYSCLLEIRWSFERFIEWAGSTMVREEELPRGKLFGDDILPYPPAYNTRNP